MIQQQQSMILSPFVRGRTLFVFFALQDKSNASLTLYTCESGFTSFLPFSFFLTISLKKKNLLRIYLPSRGAY